MAKRYYEPLGFDLNYTYRIYMSEQQTDIDEQQQLTQEDRYSYALTIMERLKQHPDIESVSLSSAAMPYSLSVSTFNFYVNTDTAKYVDLRMRYVSSGFFDVFKVRITHGKPFDWTDPVSTKQVLISPARSGLFGSFSEEVYHISDIHTLRQGNINNEPLEIIGQTEKVKDTYYQPYYSSIFRSLEKGNARIDYNELAIRIRPGAEKGFEERFMKEMSKQLAIGPYTLVEIRSLKDMRKRAANISKVTDSLNSVYSITAFLIINIFLGIIGTFWYRTESRKSEIGLRLALGSSKREVKALLYTETLLLLFVSSVIGVNICINIGQSDIPKMLGIPRADSVQAGSGVEQYFITFAITFIFLAIISLIAVWYPAKQSSDIPPAEALHEE